MNLKDKFTFEYKGKTIKVEKTGVDVWCAIHPQGEKPDIATPLAFVPVGVGSVDVRKRKDNKLLVCLQLLDITKPEQPKQKEIAFTPEPIKIGGLRLLELKDGSLQITAAGNERDLISIHPKSANSVIIKYT